MDSQQPSSTGHNFLESAPSIGPAEKTPPNAKVPRLSYVDLNPSKITTQVLLLCFANLILSPMIGFMIAFMLHALGYYSGRGPESTDFFIIIGFTFISISILVLVPCVFLPRFRSGTIGMNTLIVSHAGFLIYRQSRRLHIPWTEFRRIDTSGYFTIRFKHPLKPFEFAHLNRNKRHALREAIYQAECLGLLDAIPNDGPELPPIRSSAFPTSMLLIERKALWNHLLWVLVLVFILPVPGLLAYAVSLLLPHDPAAIPTFILTALTMCCLSYFFLRIFNHNKCVKLRTDETGVSFYDKRDLILHSHWHHITSIKYRFLKLTCKIRLANGKIRKVKFPLCTNDEAQSFISEWSLHTRAHEDYND